MCRSSGGTITAILTWRHYGDLGVAPLCRSSNGAIGAVADSQYVAGSSYVVFGHTGSFSPVISLSSLNGTNGFRIDGTNPGTTLGSKVNAAGDVNGDGFSDLVIGGEYCDCNGSFGNGSAYVVFGHAGPYTATFSVASLNGSNGFRIYGENNEDFLGTSVAAADFNNDGYDDVILGAPQASPNSETYAGSVYVIFGHQ